MIGDVIPTDANKPVDRTQPAPLDHEDEEYYRDSINNGTDNYAQSRAVDFALASLALALRDEDGGDGESTDENGDKKEETEENSEEPKKEEESENAEEPKKEEEKKKSKQELEKEREEKFEQLVLAGLKDLITHRVGHTLGLRHNFQASSWLTLEEINDPNRSKEFGHASSVMDYLPINIAPKGRPQGDYFMSGLGPYDYLAIEYGYKILGGGTEGEKRELTKIAAKQAEDGYNYSTDEDLSSVDPRTATYDLGKHPLDFSKWGLELYNQLLPEILDRAIRQDGQYRDVGRYYMLLVNQRMQQNNFLIRNLNGLYRNRDRKGDPGDRLPMEVVDTKTKRESVQFLCDNTFGADAFRIAPEIYNRFGGEIWLNDFERVERTTSVSLSSTIISAQCSTLGRLLSSSILNALTDTALRVPESEDVYTIDELFSTITASVFSELDTIKDGGEFSARKPAIPPQRRALQEHYFILMAEYASGDAMAYYFYPDANSSRPLARQELQQLITKIQVALNTQMDAGSKAHLSMLQDRIKKLLEANVIIRTP
jgi:hypothetical protein